jgi:Tfp pilus assembly protein PilN
LLALTNKQISDRTAEKASLQAEEAQAQATADALAPYAEFAQESSARSATVTSLAQSRFDWVRVMKELALVLPDDVWLTSLSGSVSAGGAGEGSSGLAEGLEVPTLSLKGCATGHDAVAAFIETLEDIDGVTRVGVASSQRSDESSAGAGGGGGSASCQTRNFIATFDIAVAFDAATVPAAAAAPALPAEPSDSAVVSDPQVADGQQQEQQARDDTTEQTDKAGNAADIIPGVAR